MDSDNEALTIEEVLEEVNQFFPYNKEQYIAYKYYNMLTGIMDNPDDEEAFIKMEDYIEEQLEKLEDTIERYEEMEVAPEVSDVHNNLLKAFDFFYKGLDKLGEFFETENPEDLSLAFEHIIDADELFIEIEKATEDFAKNNPITTTA